MILNEALRLNDWIVIVILDFVNEVFDLLINLILQKSKSISICKEAFLLQ